jgi:sulfur carrier protein ThiS
MKVQVFLHGRLSQAFDGYSCSKGLEIELESGATVKGLLSALKVAESAGAAVARKGRMLKPNEEIFPGDQLDLLQAMAGG